MSQIPQTRNEGAAQQIVAADVYAVERYGSGKRITALRKRG